MCASSPTMTSSPRWQWASIAARLLWVPLVVRRAASLPMTSAAPGGQACAQGDPPLAGAFPQGLIGLTAADRGHHLRLLLPLQLLEQGLADLDHLLAAQAH